MNDLKQKLEATRSTKEEGFSLIELMIVVVIIGILAAIAIPVFRNQQNEAMKASLKSDVHNAQIAVASSGRILKQNQEFEYSPRGDQSNPEQYDPNASSDLVVSEGNYILISPLYKHYVDENSTPDGYAIYGENKQIYQFCYNSITMKSGEDVCDTLYN